MGDIKTNHGIEINQRFSAKTGNSGFCLVLMAFFDLNIEKKSMKNIPWKYGNARWFGGRGPSADSSDSTWMCFLVDFLQIVPW